MKNQILDDDNLEYTNKPKPLIFKFAFSIEGLLFSFWLATVYLGYWLSHGEQGAGLMGEIWVVFSTFISVIWQMLGSFLWQITFVREQWRSYHFVMCLLTVLLVTAIFFLTPIPQEPLFPLQNLSLYIIWQLLSFAYIYICFFRKKLS